MNRYYTLTASSSKPSFSSTTILDPSAASPEMIIRATGVSICLTMKRFSGRAP